MHCPWKESPKQKAANWEGETELEVHENESLKSTEVDGEVGEFMDSETAQPEDNSAELVKRPKWSRQLEFTMSCIGYSVGLGNFWRFPFLCMRNGGGAFLIPYFTFLLLCGMPLFFLEVSIAQFSGLSPLCLWNICPLFKGIGLSMTILSGIMSIYYIVIIAWVIYFLCNSFTRQLPWATCNNYWNTEHCFQRTEQNFSCETVNATSCAYNNDSVYSNVTESVKKMTAAEEFWQYNVLELSPGIHDLGYIRWPLLLSLLAAWLLVWLSLAQGIKTSGKVVYFTATVPYVFLTLLLVRGLLLPGAVDGILFYIKPDFRQLLNINVWAEACLQIFYSLGPAWGGLVTMASYNSFNNNCLRDSIIVSLTCCGTSFYAGFVCFSILGHMAHDAGVPVQDVVTTGPGLAFYVYPEAITKLPISPLWAIFFFCMLLTLGIDCQFGTFETCTSGIIDQFPKLLRRYRILFGALFAVFCFLIGIPFVTQGGMYLFQIVDWYAPAFSAMTIAFLECIVLAWIYRVDRLYIDIALMIGRKPNLWWKICWCYITPSLLLAMIIYSSVNMAPVSYGVYKYPSWAIAFGWVLAMCTVVPIPAVALYQIIKAKGSLLSRIKTLLKPTADWGPNQK